MQRTEADGIIISCDFCGTDWDAYDATFARPMVEGHKGSVICLECVKSALREMACGQDEYFCALCVQDGLPADLPRWQYPEAQPSPGLNAGAIACKTCIFQAAGRFSKDPDVNWKWDRYYGAAE